MPSFYQNQLGLSQGKSTALFGLLLVVGGIPGTVWGGWIADRWVHRVLGARVVIPAVCMIVSATLFVLSFARIAHGLEYLLQLVGPVAGAFDEDYRTALLIVMPIASSERVAYCWRASTSRRTPPGCSRRSCPPWRPTRRRRRCTPRTIKTRWWTARRSPRPARPSPSRRRRPGDRRPRRRCNPSGRRRR